ncbi:hypothetical protein Tco_0692254 [Tanacetum coccineum]
MPRECLIIIESKSKVRQYEPRHCFQSEYELSHPAFLPMLPELKDMVRALIPLLLRARVLLPSNTIANPKGDVKAITTRSGVSYNGPQISSPPMENEPEVTKDTVQPSTENIQPSVVHTNDQIGELVVASKTKQTLPYPQGPTKRSSSEKDDLTSF